MSDTFSDFKDDFTDIYPNFDFNIIEQIIDELFDNDFENCTISGFDVFCSVEKIHVLQKNVSIHFENETENIEFYLEYESGINNGTQLNRYSFTYLQPEKRTVEVLKDVKFDYERWRNYFGKEFSKSEKLRCENIFESNYKSQILKLLKEQSYDNYVTGGGTIKTDNYYAKLKSDFNSRGVFWSCVYEEIEV